MSDHTTRHCGYCHKNRPWHWTGQKLKDGSKIYVDGSGHRWAGRRCPTCEKSRVASAIRHDDFDREMIFRQLTDRGFKIKSKTHPVTVERNGQTLQVGIKRARMEGQEIIIESPANEQDDIVALVFESVRLVTPDQIVHMNVYKPAQSSEEQATRLAVQDDVTGDAMLPRVVEHVMDAT